MILTSGMSSSLICCLMWLEQSQRIWICLNKTSMVPVGHQSAVTLLWCWPGAAAGDSLRSNALNVSCFFSGDNCRKGGQLQRPPQSSIHQHQEQDDLPVCQPERQRLSGAEDLWLPAADDLQNILGQGVCRELQQFGWWGLWKTPGVFWFVQFVWGVHLLACLDWPLSLAAVLRNTTYPDAQSNISFKSHGVCIWEHKAGQNLIDNLIEILLFYGWRMMKSFILVTQQVTLVHIVTLLGMVQRSLNEGSNLKYSIIMMILLYFDWIHNCVPLELHLQGIWSP